MSTVIHNAGSSSTAAADSRITRKMLQALAPLPDTALRLLSMLDDPDVPLREIASVAVRDMGLSATMLRMANSSMFGLRGRVGTVSDALRVIGTAQARLLVLASGVSQAAQKELPHYGLSAGALMRHSELAANATMYVAYEMRYTNIGIAYSAGLLHDIGKIVINGLMRAPNDVQSAGLDEEMRRSQCDLLHAEEAACGSNHAQVGGQLAELWSLPADLTAAIALHHAALSPEGDVLAWCVAVANGIAGAVDPDYPSFNRAPEIDPAGLFDLDKALAATKQCLANVA